MLPFSAASSVNLGFTIEDKSIFGQNFDTAQPRATMKWVGLSQVARPSS